MRNTVILYAGMCLLGAGLVRAQSSSLPDGPGKATTEKICGACHSVDAASGRRESREGWSAIVNEMVQRGAGGTDDELTEVVDYLTRNFPKAAPAVKVNVNKATAKDLETELSLPGSQAAAIVRQREEKGDFKSIEDLEKVPGLDVAKIEANKNRLSF